MRAINRLLSTVSTCSFDAATGALAEIQTTSALPEGVKVGVDGESFCAAIRISQDGQWLYASNRGHDTIARSVSVVNIVCFQAFYIYVLLYIYYLFWLLVLRPRGCTRDLFRSLRSVGSIRFAVFA